MSKMLSSIANEIDMNQVINDIDEKKELSERIDSIDNKKTYRNYYVSASPDNHRETRHIHSILKRKNRIYSTHFPFQRDLKENIVQESKPIIEKSNTNLTIIILWSSFYQENPRCIDELRSFIQINKNYPTVSVIFLLLTPDCEIPKELSQDWLCLPGFDRVSRELAIFKIVEEEKLMNEK